MGGLQAKLEVNSWRQIPVIRLRQLASKKLKYFYSGLQPIHGISFDAWGPGGLCPRHFSKPF